MLGTEVGEGKCAQHSTARHGRAPSEFHAVFVRGPVGISGVGIVPDVDSSNREADSPVTGTRGYPFNVLYLSLPASYSVTVPGAHWGQVFVRSWVKLLPLDCEIQLLTASGCLWLLCSQCKYLKFDFSSVASVSLP